MKSSRPVTRRPWPSLTERIQRVVIDSTFQRFVTYFFTRSPCRARAVLLTLSGWTSPRIAEAFGVREDTVRLWRGDFARGGVDALKARIAPGPEPVKSTVALRVVTPLLEEPVADRKNWTIARLRAEIETREGVRISRSQLSKVLRKKSSVGGGPGTR